MPNGGVLVAAAYLLVPAAALVSVGVLVATLKRRAIVAQLRVRHTAAMQRWIDKQDSEKESKRIFNAERLGGTGDDEARYRIDVDKASGPSSPLPPSP